MKRTCYKSTSSTVQDERQITNHKMEERKNYSHTENKSTCTSHKMVNKKQVIICKQSTILFNLNFDINTWLAFTEVHHAYRMLLWVTLIVSEPGYVHILYIHVTPPPPPHTKCVVALSWWRIAYLIES